MKKICLIFMLICSFILLNCFLNFPPLLFAVETYLSPVETHCMNVDYFIPDTENLTKQFSEEAMTRLRKLPALLDTLVASLLFLLLSECVRCCAAARASAAGGQRAKSTNDAESLSFARSSGKRPRTSVVTANRFPRTLIDGMECEKNSENNNIMQIKSSTNRGLIIILLKISNFLKIKQTF